MLVNIPNGNLNKGIEFEKLLDPDKIMQIIKKWMKNFHCTISDCKYEPKMVYINEGLDKIYCEIHANIEDHKTNPLMFEDVLKTNESLLNASERNLLQ